MLSGVSSIKDIPVLQTVLQQATAAVRAVLRPGLAARGARCSWPRRCAACWSRPSPAPTTSSTYAQALAGVATAPDDLALLAGLLDGTASVDGLAVDTELRWLLLHRLVSRGAAGPDAIDAELDRDRDGRRRAATRRPAGPRSRTRTPRRRPGS